MGQPKADLEAFRAELAPQLARLPRTLLTGHYGATRGLNELAACDTLVTLGDPWMNLDAAQNDAAFLGLGDTWAQRYEARCRAELEQAHGRLRTIHRTRPGRALHVGAVLPGERGWETGEVRVERLKGEGLNQHFPPLKPSWQADPMSWDVSVMRFSKSYVSVDEILDSERPLPLGPLTDVQSAVTAVFGDADFSDPSWGRWESNAGSIEFNIGAEEPVESMMLHVRASTDVIPMIVELCRRNSWQALDCIEGEFLADESATQGLEGWIAFRNRVIGGGA